METIRPLRRQVNKTLTDELDEDSLDALSLNLAMLWLMTQMESTITFRKVLEASMR